MSHTRNELLKAYKEGIQKVWVTNFGAIKPLEQQLSFYAKLAWEADGMPIAILKPLTKLFLTRWLDSMFTGQPGKATAPLLLEFDQLTNARKLEHMDDDCFSQTAFEMKQQHACIVMNIFAVSWRRFMRTCQSRRRMPFSR